MKHNLKYVRKRFIYIDYKLDSEKICAEMMKDMLGTNWIMNMWWCK